jgi:hypothetical protein
MPNLSMRLARLEAATAVAPTERDRYATWLANLNRDPWEPFWEQFSDAELDALTTSADIDPLFWSEAQRAAHEHYASVMRAELASAIDGVERGAIDVCETWRGPCVFPPGNMGTWADHYRGNRLRECVPQWCEDAGVEMPRTSAELLALLREWVDE